jgi:hypothetical protein
MTQPTIPMPSAVAAWLTMIGQAAAAIGALLLATEPSAVPFGIDPFDFGLTLVFASNVATAVVVALRKNLLPGITSGSGVT